MLNRLLIAVAVAAAGWAGLTQLSVRKSDPVAMPKASPSDPQKVDVVTLKRLEVVDDTGKVVIVFTQENGIPVAIVSDNGVARRIDLAKVARMVK